LRTDKTFAAFTDRLMDFMRTVPLGLEAEDARFAELALDLFELQFRHVRVFRALCEARGIAPGSLTSWRDIPTVPTRAFQSFDLSSLGNETRSRMFLSSGTASESRSRHFHSDESLQIYEASLAHWFAAHLLADDADVRPAGEMRPFRLLVLTPDGRAAANSSLAHMFETVAGRFRFDTTAFVGRVSADGAWELDLARADTFLQGCVADGQPVLILGTAFSFVHLLDHLATGGRRLRLPMGSRAMETGGYKGRSRSLARNELHALIADRLGIAQRQIVSEYGMSELSSQAYDHAAGAPGPDGDLAGRVAPSRADWIALELDGRLMQPRSFQFPRWARFRIISPETGKEADPDATGIVQVFDLANVYSVMAVQTEDLGIRRGTGFELVGRAVASAERGCSLMMQ
jgi:hypothetical protein